MMPVTSPPSAPLRLATYNIRKCLGTDGRRAPGRVLDVINAMGADIVALQEADRRLGARPEALPARLVEEHSDFRAVALSTSSVSVGWNGNAILVRKSAQVGRVERIELPGLEPRGAVSVEVNGLRVVAVHLGLLRRSRRAQLQRLRDHLSDGAPHPTVLLGDFNEWSPRKGMEPLDGAYSIVAPGRSFHAARPLAALDRFALSTSIGLHDAGVVETVLSRVASDHLPVWADVLPPAIQHAA